MKRCDIMRKMMPHRAPFALIAHILLASGQLWVGIISILRRLPSLLCKLPAHTTCIAKSHLAGPKLSWVTKLNATESFPLLCIIQAYCNTSRERYSLTSGHSSLITVKRSNDPELSRGIERWVAGTYDERAEGNLFFFNALSKRWWSVKKRL